MVHQPSAKQTCEDHFVQIIPLTFLILLFWREIFAFDQISVRSKSFAHLGFALSCIFVLKVKTLFNQMSEEEEGKIT